MKSIIAFFRLIRITNLMFVALTQFLIQFAVIKPILASAGLTASLSTVDFLLLVLSTVLIAAGGYVINDYFDLKIDSFNKPKRITIGINFKSRGIILLHLGLNFLAIAIGIYVSWKAGNLKLCFINPITAGLLWFYSTGYKKQPFIGNVVVSFLTAMVVLIVVLYESQLFHPSDIYSMQAAKTIFIVTFFYFLFAFFISLMREIVKDMEDIAGDSNYGCRTLPIVIGMERSKQIVYVIGFMLMSGIAYVEYFQWLGKDFLSTFYLFVTLQAPLLVMLYFLRKANHSKQFGQVSTLIKLVMLLGILTMAYFYLLIQNQTA